MTSTTTGCGAGATIWGAAPVALNANGTSSSIRALIWLPFVIFADVPVLKNPTTDNSIAAATPPVTPLSSNDGAP